MNQSGILRTASAQLSAKHSCEVCNKPYVKQRMGQKVCGPKCAVQSVKLSTKARKEKIKSRADHLGEAQTPFNAWVRARDANDGCISCDKPASWGGQWHAGHYKSVGAHPKLRFDEDNVHKQCSQCNNFLSGNIINYRPRLVAKIGLIRVVRLESFIDAEAPTVEEIKAIKSTYKFKLKELTAAPKQNPAIVCAMQGF